MRKGDERYVARQEGGYRSIRTTYTFMHESGVLLSVQEIASVR
jgi:hypothetical protein